ncbi:MAG: TRAP transporter small permease [Wenzhouxiangella sp.]
MNRPEPGDGVFEQIQRGLDRLESSLLTTLLLALIGLGLAQILLRNFAGISLPWADGAMRAMVLWLAMIAGAIAAGKLKHIRIDVAERWLAPTVRVWSHRVIMLATAGVCLIMTWLSLSMVALEYEFRAVAFLDVPNWVVVFIVPIGFGLMAARFAGHAFTPSSHIIAPPGPEPVDAEPQQGRSAR